MSWSKPLLQILTLRCKEASLLASRELDEPLNLAERIALRGHHLICSSCRRFGQQIRFLHRAFQERAERQPGWLDEEALSAHARERIEQVLTRAMGEAEDPPE
jgi:hypothetical protein